MQTDNEKPYESKFKVRGDVHISSAVTYQFWFEPNGWANYTLNDTTGEFVLQSDWGDYQHRWHVGAIGKKTLHEFIAKAGTHYIADKFSYNRQPDLKDVVDEVETLKHIEEILREKYPCDEEDEEDRKESKDKLEELIEKAKEWVGHHHDYDDSAFIEVYYRDDYEELRDELKAYEPWELIQHKKSQRYVFLVEFLLPTFQEYLKKRLAEQKSQTDPQEQTT